VIFEGFRIRHEKENSVLATENKKQRGQARLPDHEPITLEF
jgi:hypothetical protein